MTPNARQLDLLRTLQAAPRTLRHFSHGFQKVAPSVTEADFSKLKKAGYVSETADTFFITPDGDSFRCRCKGADSLPCLLQRFHDDPLQAFLLECS